LKYMFPHLKPYRFQFVIGPLFKLLEAVLELTMPLYMARIVDVGIPAGDRTYILKMGGWMLLTATVGLCSAMICQYSASVASQGFGTSLRDGLFKKVLGLSFAQVEAFGVGTLTNRITNDVNQLQLAVAMSIRLVIRAPFICIGSVIATLLIDWKLGLIVLFSLPVFSAALYFVMRSTFPLYTKVQARLDEVGAKVRELLSGARIIRAFATEERETACFKQKDEAFARAAARVGAVSSAFNPITSLIMNMTIIAIIWFGGFRVYDGALTSGEILAFISYVTQMLTVLIVLANLVVIMTRAAASLRRVSEVLALPDDPAESSLGDAAGPEGGTAVEFRHVSFGYHAGGDQALEDISFQIKKGESVGIIGVTGSGKSTLCHLISRYYLPDSGEVLLFGKNAADYPVALLRRIVGAVPQKIQLFSGTVAENLRFGRPGASDAELRRAAKIAQADGFVSGLRKGYDTQLSKGGRGLSGGQRQRLAVARAVAADPALLILDDASSALDYATDLALRRAIAEEMAGVTTIVVSQRIRSIMSLDKIIVLEEGRIAGIGSHDELLATCPEYRALAEIGGGGAA
jgi:ATP-binding cassette subfamily B multidrug efflux pump